MPKFNLLVLLIIGLLLSVVNLLGYYLSGYSLIIFIFWLIAIIFCGLYFYLLENKEIKKINPFDKKDLFTIIILLFIFSPLYIAFIYTVPFQINSDEVVIASVSKEIAYESNVDLFGLSDYASNPNLIFFVWGKLAQLIGDIDFFHIRLIHAFCGLIIIVLSYLFFRLLS